MKCKYCGNHEAVGGVFCEECLKTRPDKLTIEQYLEALKKVRNRIANGIPIGLYDCNVTGYKNTYCNWGMCTESADVWDKPELHIWPMDFKENGRVAPLDSPSRCPLDYRPLEFGSGCFYKCWAFNPPKPMKLTQVGTLERYDYEIRRLEYLLKGNKEPVCCDCGNVGRYDNPLGLYKGKPICGECHRKNIKVVVHDLR